MPVGKEIFPRGCGTCLRGDGGATRLGELFIREQNASESEGNGVEHPCYSCVCSSCGVRQACHKDNENRYIREPAY
jgi:hypothetical protein